MKLSSLYALYHTRSEAWWEILILVFQGNQRSTNPLIDWTLRMLMMDVTTLMCVSLLWEMGLSKCLCPPLVSFNHHGTPTMEYFVKYLEKQERIQGEVDSWLFIKGIWVKIFQVEFKLGSLVFLAGNQYQTPHLQSSRYIQDLSGNYPTIFNI